MTLVLDRNTIKSEWPKSPASASAAVETGEYSAGRLAVTVAVADRNLREALGADGDKFDGLERPVALVFDGTQYQRHALSWVGKAPASGQAPDVDHYKLVLDKSQFDSYAAQKRGVAILLETSAGDVWLQKQDDNYTARAVDELT